MINKPCYPRLRAAVRQVHLEQLERDLVGLEGYRQALVVFRLRGAVVGQAWLPVADSRITSARLRSCLPAVAWPVWQQLFAQDHDPARPLPTASVVVCTRDRTDDLAQCLPGLSRLAAEGHEVIVVDNCPSDDRTARLVASYPAIRYLREPRPGAGIARNHGLLAATREVVAFTDDDAQVDPGWLPALLRNFDDPLVAVVTGITMPSELETEAQMWFEQMNALRYLAPLLIVCGYFSLLYAITYPEVRFSEPLHPILATLVVAAVKPREYPSWRSPASARCQRYYT